MASRHGATAQSPWIRPLGARPDARLRLFCLPFAGGGTVPFRSWPAALPPEVEAFAVCPPGREHRIDERPVARLDAMVASLVAEMGPWLDRPYALYGHSLGALVAFELARALRASGAEPALLAVGARSAPDTPVSARMSDLPDDRFVATLAARYNGIPQAVLDEPELLALFLPALRADFALLESYEFRDGARLGCPLVAFEGAGDRVASGPDVLRWREHTDGAFAHRVVEGGHFFITQGRAAFLAALSGELAAVAAG